MTYFLEPFPLELTVLGGKKRVLRSYNGNAKIVGVIQSTKLLMAAKRQGSDPKDNNTLKGLNMQQTRAAT